MSKLSRRETLARGGQAVAAAAVLPFFSATNPAHAEEDADTALFHLIAQWETVTKRMDELDKAWREEIRALVAPQYWEDPLSDPRWRIWCGLVSEKARDIQEEWRWAFYDRQAAERCIINTPARTMDGVAAMTRLREDWRVWGLRQFALAAPGRVARRAS